jgi:pimeloyl-ACP methyl ester carboxylesterase
MTPDVVFLLPGFFGFGRFGTFFYFADRLSATIRGHLEALLPYGVPVIPLETGPADGLAYRQRHFLDAIDAILPSLGGVERIHLVGHSTGGLDAELLLRRDRVDRKPWTEKQLLIRRRIASVTTIAAPHYGTTLAVTDLARWIAHPVTRFSLFGATLPAAAAFFETLPEHALSFGQVLGGSKALAQFLARFFERRQLLGDLAPELIERERATNPRDSLAPVSCFITCPLQNPSMPRGPIEDPDSLFLYLTNHTAGARVARVSPDVASNIARMNDRSAMHIESASVVPRPEHDFDEIDNDAVVNSARQLLPTAELAAIVYGDHADVLGHYDRRDPTSANRVINEGVFRSGARFGDDEFFRLYREVATRIARAAQTQPGADAGKTRGGPMAAVARVS